MVYFWDIEKNDVLFFLNFVAERLILKYFNMLNIAEIKRFRRFSLLEKILYKIITKKIYNYVILYIILKLLE